MIQFALKISQILHIKEKQTTAVLKLHEEGATIPFIARYRKDQHDNLDEVVIQQIIQTAQQLKELEDRKTTVIKSITEQNKMTDELLKKINDCSTINSLEDIYLPYKPKRKTKAQTARENGLEPLSEFILKQETNNIVEEATKYINEKVLNVDEALQGARDIIAESINENAEVRERMRNLFIKEAILTSTVYEDKKEEAIKYKDYFDCKELAKNAPSHRVLAIFRGYTEGLLKVDIHPESEQALSFLEKIYVKNNTEAGAQVAKACKESYSRLLKPSLELDYKLQLKNKADDEAIQVFATNLRQLLLSSPLGSKSILAIDPGYKTGCKIVCLDNKGDLKESSLIYIHEKYTLQDAEHIIRSLIHQFQIECIAIGDGTAGRETEKFIKSLQLNIPIYLVNEDGASIYSASEVAREEFPDKDITVRGAVSIGRRLMDPLAELVKIDAKSIGVGQYQHDVNQHKLKQQLDATVESCVNAVGVNLNTASKQLLSYVSGIGPTLAQNIIDYRKEHGKFTTRTELKKVTRLGDKAYEQAAGFLRITDGENVLDKCAVHPENYTLVETIAKDLNTDVKNLIGNNQLLKEIKTEKYSSAGTFTLRDILAELNKPGLDPRGEIETFEFANIYSIEELQVGMELPGAVTNLTKFGAFVDIGVKQDGLVHISEIAHKFIKDPAEILKLNDKVKVKVLEVDIQRKRILLSIKQTQEMPSFQKNTTKQKPVEKNMNEALADLKSKFGK